MSTAGGLMLAGDARLGFYNDAGAFLGYMKDPINMTELTLTPGEGEQQDRISKMRDSRGQALDSRVIPGPWTGTFTTDTISSEILEGLFLGVKTDITVASGAIAAEEIVARTGNWVPTSQVGFDAGSVSVTTAADAALTVDTDYLVDHRNGAILAIAGGSINDGDTIKVTATYGSRAGFNINAAQSEGLTVALLLDGRNLRSEDAAKVIRLEAKRMSIRPAGGNDFFGDGWLAGQFAVTFLTPVGEDKPFTYREYIITPTP